MVFDYSKLKTVFFGLAGGLLLSILGVPAGPAIGGMFGVGIPRSLGWGLSDPHPRFRQWIQVAIGSVIGLSFRPELLSSIPRMVVPILVLSTAMVLSGLALGRVLRTVTGWDEASCILASAPAGMSQMVLVCDSMGGKAPEVALLHLVRLTSIILVLPTLLQLLARAIN